MDRRRPDPLRGVRRAGARASRRSATSGSTPASSRSRRSAGRTRSTCREGYATGAAKGLTTADLPDHAYWEQWFPADWVSEMREQIRLWFYSQLFMSVALTGRAPFRKVLGYEKMLDETGREMHGSWGNMIDAEEAFARMGADVMRWQYCAQPPDRNLLFGFGPAQEIKRQAADALELGQVPRRLRRDRVVPARLRRPRARRARCATLQPLDRWLVERTAQLVEEAQAGYERWLTVDVTRAFDAYRRRPLELVHPPLPPPLLGRRRDGAAHALVRARAGAARDRAGDAVPRRAPLAGARRRRRRGRAGLGLPRRLARGARARRGPARRGRGAASRRRARPPGALGGRAEAPPAAAPASSSKARRSPPPTPTRSRRSCASRRSSSGTSTPSCASSRTCPCSGRSSARSSAPCGPRSRRATSRISAAAGSGPPGTSSARTRCSSSGPARRAGRSPGPTASRSRSRPRSTTSWRSRAASTS